MNKIMKLYAVGILGSTIGMGTGIKEQIQRKYEIRCMEPLSERRFDDILVTTDKNQIHLSVPYAEEASGAVNSTTLNSLREYSIRPVDNSDSFRHTMIHAINAVILTLSALTYRKIANKEGWKDED